MTRYFFHVWLGDVVERDEIGTECPDAEEAYMQAFHAAQDAWVDSVRCRNDPGRHRFEVTDAAGNILFEVPFSEVIGRSSGGWPGVLPVLRTAERTCALASEVARQVSRASDNIRTSRQLLAELETISGSVPHDTRRPR